jgi:hypothetical protein
MMKVRCPQCGAPLHGGTTCAERLYRMLVSGGISQARLGEAFAQFALSHPMTYSAEALKCAIDLLTPEPGETVEGEHDEAADAARPGSNWWRRCARRASCH